MRSGSHVGRGSVIGYLSGPTNGAEIVRAWQAGDNTDYLGTVYMAQFCEVVSSREAKGVIVTYSTAPSSREQIGDFTIYNIERRGRRGIGYHLEVARRMLASFAILFRHRAQAFVLTEGADYWFLALIPRLAGIKIIPSLHCAIWQPYAKPTVAHRVLRFLNRNLFFRLQKTSFMGVSNLIGRQVKEWAGKDAQFLRFLPTYSPETFAGISRAPEGAFTVLFGGRVERDKGVFDLLRAVEIVREKGIRAQLHICGDGSSVEEVRRLGGTDTFVHGYCGLHEMRRLLAESHVVIVPTRTDFEEGFAKICAEGVLAGRPVITSAVCPALEDLRPACIEVTPNDVFGYADAIERLAMDPQFYAQKVLATSELQSQFYDSSNSYGAMLSRALDDLG